MQFLRIAALLACLVPTVGCTSAILTGGTVAMTAAIEERRLADTLSDVAIEAEITHLWFQEDHELLQRLDMTVREGRVLLTGLAKNQDMRVDAVRLAWQPSEVREVVNEIEIQREEYLADFARDQWISMQMRGRLILDPKILSINFTIDAVAGTVYIMGIAQNPEELERVLDHARELAYVSRALHFVRIKSETDAGTRSAGTVRMDPHTSSSASSPAGLYASG